MQSLTDFLAVFNITNGLSNRWPVEITPYLVEDRDAQSVERLPSELVVLCLRQTSRREHVVSMGRCISLPINAAPEADVRPSAGCQAAWI